MPITASAIPCGLALPLARSPGGYFASKPPRDLAWGDMLVTLMTPMGSRPMRRKFGSSVSRLVFQPDLMVNDPVVVYVVGEVIRRWCPQVTITGIQVSPAAVGQPAGITVNFTVPGT